ncbi:type III-B CRISPR module RAMP protein Cmr6 [Abyssisolibacter fermentans]|uniref:type III-B CRISPR module RAMP protein Cmr6 n=1 Tax=Abyssisolibacter fermentans TaxID=1766203 RepID=UPI00082CA674|nr:type III-B CRISPR module RAMP protein Cmr6 [Abyssisolibacter fermentans]
MGDFNSIKEAFIKVGFDNPRMKENRYKKFKKTNSKAIKGSKPNNSKLNTSNDDDMNLGYIFYKEYFNQNFNEDIFTIINNYKLMNYKLNFQESDELIKGLTKQEFILKTKYPGLIMGSGYSHGLKEDDAFKLGFYFDYTSGLPVIPASTIKGTVRSIFKKLRYNRDDVPEEMIEYKENMRENALEYFKDILVGKEVNYDILKEIEYEIFEGKDYDKENDKYYNKPICSRDIFFDATLNLKENNNKIILADDYITPHKSPIKNPIPIKFLKIKPDVFFKFRFNLKKGKYLNKNDKKELIQRIIMDFGIGAKTSVGYGFMEKEDNLNE